MVALRPVAATLTHLTGETHVSNTSFQRFGAATLAAIAIAGLVSGCGSKKASNAASAVPASAAAGASAAATGSAAAAVASAAASAPTDATVKATGGGKFCQQIAGAINSSAVQAAVASGPAGLKQEAQRFQALESEVVKSAPSSLKADITTVFGAVSQFYAALAKANYDYTKVDPTSLTSMSAPAVVAAEARLDAYTKNTCGIDTGISGSAPAAGSS